MEEAQNTQRQEEAENQEVLEILIINDKCVLTLEYWRLLVSNTNYVCITNYKKIHIASIFGVMVILLSA